MKVGGVKRQETGSCDGSDHHTHNPREWTLQWGESESLGLCRDHQEVDAIAIRMRRQREK